MMFFDQNVIGTLVGLILIALGWILQLISSWNGNKGIKKRFIMVQNLGIAVIVVDNIIEGSAAIALFNAFVLIITSILLIRLGINDKKGPTRNARKRKR
jgi:hypothetical protein